MELLNNPVMEAPALPARGVTDGGPKSEGSSQLMSPTSGCRLRVPPALCVQPGVATLRAPAWEGPLCPGALQQPEVPWVPSTAVQTDVL